MFKNKFPFDLFLLFLINFNFISSQLLESTVIPDGIFSNNTYYNSENDFNVYIPRGNTSGYDNFTWDFLKNILTEETKENVIISPFSVKLVMALLVEAAGTKSVTQKELLNTQMFNTTESIRQYYKNTLAALNNKGDQISKVNLETKLFTNEFIEPQQRYAAMLLEHYNTEIQSLDFSKAKNAATLINTWCSNATNGKIQQIVNEDSIQNNVMLLVNVIYFKGLWRSEFNDTFEGAYFKTPKDQIKVDYMEQLGQFYYLNSDICNCKILRLPYKETSFSMFVLLPNSENDISEMVSLLNADNITRMQWLMEERKVKINLPKFKFQFNKSLKEILNNLGVNDIFTSSASLPGLARGGDVAGKVMVTNIIQTAGIDVNEKGTEASAATVVEIGNKFGGSEVIEEFIVNRPFLFFIEDEVRGQILFAGKVLVPHY